MKLQLTCREEAMSRYLEDPENLNTSISASAAFESKHSSLLIFSSSKTETTKKDEH
jgi:hypothetical protein